jgi:hypothetical protein
MFPFLVELVIFGSVRFLSKNSNQTDLKKKPKSNRTGRFFQNFNRFNRFFFDDLFFQLFFFIFSI